MSVPPPTEEAWGRCLLVASPSRPTAGVDHGWLVIVQPPIHKRASNSPYTEKMTQGDSAIVI